MNRGKYTVNEVEERTRVPASTLRQWERRYGFPKPARSEAGYRLYSDVDLDSIDAMKRHIADGIPASRAADLVRASEHSGPGRPLDSLRDELVATATGFDEEALDRVLGQAFSLHPVETVVARLLPAVMLQLGQQYDRGTVEAGVVTWTGSYLGGRLQELIRQAPANRGGQAILVATGPADLHQLGALTLTLLLRRAGHRAIFMGPALELKELEKLCRRLSPVAVLFSVSRSESLAGLHGQGQRLRRLAPVVALGGPATDAGQVSSGFAHAEEGPLLLTGSALAAVERIRELISTGGGRW